MEPELKSLMLTKLKAQQAIIENSSDEVDFRRAEITVGICNAIIDVHRIDLEISKSEGEIAKIAEGALDILLDLQTQTERQPVDLSAGIIPAAVEVTTPLDSPVATTNDSQAPIKVKRKRRTKLEMRQAREQEESERKSRLQKKPDPIYDLTKKHVEDATPVAEEKPKVSVQVIKGNWPIARLKGFRKGQEVEYMDMVRDRKFGVIHSFSEAGTMTPMGNVFLYDVATIRDHKEGTLIDREFRLFREMPA